MAYDTTQQGSGILFTNDRKKNEKAPDYTGNIEITPEFWDLIKSKMNGGSVKLDLAGWAKKGQRGNFVSLSVRPPFEKSGGMGNQSRGSRLPNDDIPF